MKYWADHGQEEMKREDELQGKIQHVVRARSRRADDTGAHLPTNKLF